MSCRKFAELMFTGAERRDDDHMPIKIAMSVSDGLPFVYFFNGINLHHAGAVRTHVLHASSDCDVCERRSALTQHTYRRACRYSGMRGALYVVIGGCICKR